MHTSIPPCRARGAPLYDSDFEEMYGGSAGAPLLGGSETDGVDEAREEVEATFGHAFHAEQPGVWGRTTCSLNPGSLLVGRWLSRCIAAAGR